MIKPFFLMDEKEKEVYLDAIATWKHRYFTLKAKEDKAKTTEKKKEEKAVKSEEAKTISIKNCRICRKSLKGNQHVECKKERERLKREKEKRKQEKEKRKK
jgi:hypothetical protein